MIDDLFATQQAVFNALSASTDLQNFLGSPPRLYDHVPQGDVFPFAVYSTTHIAPYDTKTEIGFEQTIEIDIFSRYRGSKEARDILQAVYNALHRATLSISGFVLIACEFHSAEILLENDGLTTRANARFTVLTQVV